MIATTSTAVFGMLDSGYWMVGLKYFGIAFDSNGWCTKFTGIVEQCTTDELYLMISISKLFLN